MDWFSELLFGTGIAHSILILALVISIGLLLGKIKVFGISLGTTWKMTNHSCNAISRIRDALAR